MAVLPSISRSQSGRSGSGNFLSYPEELGTMDRHNHYVMFFINVPSKGSSINYGSGAFAPESSAGSTRNDPGTLTIKRAETKQLAQAIALYMPNQIQVSHKANYGEAEIGAAVAGAMGSYADFQNENVSAMGFAGKIGKGVVSEAAKGLAKLADSSVAPGALAAYEIGKGMVTNNRTEMKFEGVDRRSFTFDFTLLPTNAKEAAAIEQIVTAFRFHSMPEINGDAITQRTMLAPSTFDIEYRPIEHLHRIATSVLENVEVKYGGDRPQFFTDGQPVQTQLTLTFKELGIITKKQIGEGF